VHLVGFYYKNISRCTGPLNVKDVNCITETGDSAGLMCDF